jgi:hypothetical protein
MKLIDLTIPESILPDNLTGEYCILSDISAHNWTLYQKAYYKDNILLWTEQSGFFDFKDYDMHFYNANGNFHNEFTAAKIFGVNINPHKEYWLNGKYYGSNKDYAEYFQNCIVIPSDEYWIKYQKLKAFQ